MKVTEIAMILQDYLSEKTSASEAIDVTLALAERYKEEWKRQVVSVFMWQPIVSAPRDGSQVLLYFPKRYQGKGGISWGCFLHGDWLDSRAIRDNDASHWMPMPAPPSAPCKTCGGRGEIGGFVNADSGYQTDPCPDCSSLSSQDYRSQGE